MTISVIVKLQFEGIHCWPECPFDEVSFLRNRHRHIFHVTAEKKVTHTDRDVEIIMLKRKIKNYTDNVTLGRMSCEDIALAILSKFELSSCEVLEDNENGAKVTR